MSDNDEQDQEKTEEEAGQPEGPPPTEPRVPAWPGLGQILAGLAGLGVLVTGAAFLIGWRYTAAFYDRLGIPSRALDLEPTDYITAKVDVWYGLLLAGALGLATLGLMRYVWPEVGRVSVRLLGREVMFEFAAQRAWLLIMAVGASSLVVGTSGLLLRGEETFLYPFTMGVVYIPLAVWGLVRESPDWGRLATPAALAVAVFLAVPSVAPMAAHMGREDADAVLTGSEAGVVRLIAREPLGLPTERHESGTYVTEAVRLITATNNCYFVVVGDGDTVYCVGAADVLRVEYEPSDER